MPRALLRRAIAGALLLGCGVASAVDLTLVSRSDDPARADGLTGRHPDMDASGETIVFASNSSALDDALYRLTLTTPPGGVFSGASQIYALEPRTGAQTLISDEMPPGGIAVGGDFDSVDPSISPSGRYVAYASSAMNLVPGVYGSPAYEVFRHDRDTGTTLRLTSLAAGSTRAADVADNGRVAFETAANVAGDSNGVADIYVVSGLFGALTRVSAPDPLLGYGAPGVSQAPAVSGDGRYVVFESLASNLTPLDTNAASDVFLYELGLGTRQRVSDAPGADQVGAGSHSADVSHDGRYVVFVSEATNLIPGDVWAGGEQVFLRDRQRGVTTRLSRELATLGLHTPSAPRIAANGEYVLFEARATPTERALVRYEVRAAALELVGRFPLGLPSRASAHAISDDGRRVAFDNAVPVPVPGVVTGFPEVYRADFRPGSLAFAASELRIDEGAGSLALEVRRNDGSDGAVSAWVTFERSAATDAALPNWDYASYATDGGWLLSWAAGDATPRVLEVPIVQDAREEADEHLRLRLSESVGGATLGPLDEIEIVIADDD